MNEKNYLKLLTFVRKLSLPSTSIERLYKLRKLTEEDGDSAEDIFINGTDFMEASVAIDARSLLKELQNEEND